jgi:hypothetical protein
MEVPRALPVGLHFRSSSIFSHLLSYRCSPWVGKAIASLFKAFLTSLFILPSKGEREIITEWVDISPIRIGRHGFGIDPTQSSYSQ